MVRRNGRLVQILAGLLGLLAVQGARASDIPCNAPVGGPGARCEEPYGAGVGCETPPAQRVRKGHLICEYTMLSQRYERIYAEQQRMLQKGTIQAADLAAWRARRDACDSVRCLDGVFHQFWRQRDAMPKSAGKPAMARQGAAQTQGSARHEPASRPLTAPAKAASRDTSATAPAAAAAAVVAPSVAEASIAPDAPLARRAPGTHPVSTAHKASSTTTLEIFPDANVSAVPISLVTPQPRISRRPAPLLLESLLSGLAVLGLGAALVWKRRRGAPRAGSEATRERIPPIMKITYGLLLVNALLLPFTLGLR